MKEREPRILFTGMDEHGHFTGKEATSPGEGVKQQVELFYNGEISPEFTIAQHKEGFFVATWQTPMGLEEIALESEIYFLRFANLPELKEESITLVLSGKINTLEYSVKRPVLPQQIRDLAF